ncbi:MAG: Helix-turn-helix domain [Rhodospirillales bacterium]|jgi:transcriptional regulator with XRE-family HTH domain|nr:Helix-turn-helix domain [Rhodospirillales bacterium]
MDIRQVIALQLRQHRRRRKLTPAVLARRAGVDRAMIRRLEEGKANPPIDVIGRLAEALDIEPQELLALRRVSATSALILIPASVWSIALSSSVADFPKRWWYWPPRHQTLKPWFAFRSS